MKKDKGLFYIHLHRLEIKFTPYTVLLLKLYHMPKFELSEFLKNELEKNMLLEEKVERGEEKEEEREDFALDELIQGFGDDFTYVKTGDAERDDPIELVAAPPPSLYEMVGYQIEASFKNEIDKKIAYLLLENLNEDGYLKKSPKELAEIAGVSLNRLEEVRDRFMRFDPVGIGSRDIVECIKVQLEEKGEEEEFINFVIKCVENVCEEEKLDEFKEKFKLKEEEIERILKVVKSLSPRPALKYSSEKSPYVYPEVVVAKKGERFIPLIDETGLPKIKINRRYLELLRSKKLSSEDKEILRNHLQRAINIFKALNQRKVNLMKIAEFIIDKNKEFFEGKTNRVFPLTQSDAAQILKMKISTFHKLIAGKYIDTPRGIFEMRFFFPGGIKTKGGRVSREEVKEMIMEIVEKEDKKNPFTDEVIAEILQADGIRIKRRTVQKLREEMGIPNSNKRRRKRK